VNKKKKKTKRLRYQFLPWRTLLAYGLPYYYYFIFEISFRVVNGTWWDSRPFLLCANLTELMAVCTFVLFFSSQKLCIRSGLPPASIISFLGFSTLYQKASQWLYNRTLYTVYGRAVFFFSIRFNSFVQPGVKYGRWIRNEFHMRWRVNDSTHVLERDTSHPAAAPYSYFLNAHQTCFEKYSLMFKNGNREERGNE
jgi:hypothetical protein